MNVLKLFKKLFTKKEYAVKPIVVEEEPIIEPEINPNLTVEQEEEKYLNGEDSYVFIGVSNEDILHIDEADIETLIKEELDLWGINSNLMSYKAICNLSNVENECNNYSELLQELSKMMNKPKGVISSSLAHMIKVANFSNSRYECIRYITKNEEPLLKLSIMIIYKWAKEISNIKK